MINIKKLHFEKLNNESFKSSFPFTERKEIKYTPINKKPSVINHSFSLNYFKLK